MGFTEHGLTAARTGAAKAVVAAQRKDVRRGSPTFAGRAADQPASSPDPARGLPTRAVVGTS